MAKKKVSTDIPADIKRRIKVEAGFRCSVWRCGGTSGLESHHIDGDPSNHDPANLLLLCAVCHDRATKGEIDRKACEMIKRDLVMRHLPRSELQLVKDDIISEMRKLVGTQDVARPLAEEEKGTRAPDPRTDAAASQAITFEKVCLPLPIGILRALAHSLYKSGEFEGALAIQRLVTATADAMPGDYSNLGNLLYETGRKDEAEHAWRKAVEADPKLAKGWGNLGFLLHETGRKDEAEEALRKAVEADPGEPEYHNGLAYFLCECGRLEEADAEVREALRLDPDRSYANATLGLLFFEKNNLEGGRKAYERAIELRPDDMPLRQKFHYEYGRALARNGRLGEARRELEAALKVDAAFVPKERIEAEIKKLG